MWHNKRETERSFFVDREAVRGEKNDYKLFMNYHKPRVPVKNPKELQEICEAPILGGTPPKSDESYYGGDHLWVNISDMKAKRVVDTETKLSDKGAERLSRKSIKKGTLLMSFKLTLGKTAYAGADLFTNEAICGLVPKDKSDDTVAEYLYYVLPLLNYLPYAQRAAKGLTLNKELIRMVEVPFPEKEERKRISENLKRMTHDLKQKREKYARDLEQREQQIQDYMQDILTED